MLLVNIDHIFCLRNNQLCEVPKFDAQSLEPLSRGTYEAWMQPLESPGHGSQVFPTVPVENQNEFKMGGYPGFFTQQSLAILGSPDFGHSHIAQGSNMLQPV